MRDARVAKPSRLLSGFAVVFGLLFVAAGVTALFAGVGAALGTSGPSGSPTELARAGNAGLAIAFGLLFTVAGSAMALFPLARRLSAGLALAALLLFVIAVNWVAFAPGERTFTRSTGLSTAASARSTTQTVTETEGRFVFGAFALGLDLLLLAGLIRIIRSR